MKLGEFFKGTREERAAASTVRRLNNRSDGRRALSHSQKRELERSRVLARRLTRRRFLAGGAAVAVSAALGGLGWEIYKEETAKSDDDAILPEVLTPEPKIDSLESWRALSSRDRLQRLFQKKTPEVEGFDKLNELVQASAEFYVSQVPSKYTAKELADKTSFVRTKEEHVNIRIENGALKSPDPTISIEDLRKLGLNGSTGTTSPSGDVYINVQLIQERIDEGKAKKSTICRVSRNNRRVSCTGKLYFTS